MYTLSFQPDERWVDDEWGALPLRMVYSTFKEASDRHWQIVDAWRRRDWTCDFAGHDIFSVAGEHRRIARRLDGHWTLMQADFSERETYAVLVLE